MQGANIRWTAIIFEIGELNRRKLDLMPGTWKAVFRLLSPRNRLALFRPSKVETAQLGRPPRDYYEGDQRYWYGRVTSGLQKLVQIPGYVLSEQLGLDDLCFDGSGRTNRRSKGVASRLFLVKNVKLEHLNCRIQELGYVDEGITLV